MKILRPSVMAAREWFKERDPEEWRRIRKQALERDHYTCVYCALSCRRFMQVNHIGAEDDHRLENLETVCPACHSVMHLGINAMQGVITLFECKPKVTNMAEIVRATRSMVNEGYDWDEIEIHTYGRFRRTAGRIYEKEGSLEIANQLVSSIQAPVFRAYLPEGLAIVFHEQGAWNNFPERTWKWQCIAGSRYRKEPQA
ncbi:HNH endonuclease [Dictyobacter formicarum]|uniref:HNH nuclease domain-containing protein n=1 Tax=Dictyobacter formicarum TaxID=2778368 RepID=A0ABQ3VFT1_9CHLR|nr:HNH endonuclease [Dictyobacter formicarum]GHO84772.1 hypothetical protein KSZ_27780 [Dictyobacter formicarum]